MIHDLLFTRTTHWYQLYTRSLNKTVSKDIPADYDRSKYNSILAKFFFAIEFFIIPHMQIEISIQIRFTVYIHSNENIHLSNYEDEDAKKYQPLASALIADLTHTQPNKPKLTLVAHHVQIKLLINYNMYSSSLQ